tara:strand:+ start:330 stop:461 length:132 start_codon:yes stop_codon:yes gene_type:complete
LKTFSFFALMVYWSAIILAPVLSKEFKIDKEQLVIKPLKKPSK